MIGNIIEKCIRNINVYDRIDEIRYRFKRLQI